MILLILAFIAGMFVDNMFAPKIKMENGKLTVEWSNKKINKN